MTERPESADVRALGKQNLSVCSGRSFVYVVPTDQHCPGDDGGPAATQQAARFYETVVGLTRAAFSPPHAVVFNTSPIPFAVRDVAPGVDLASITQPGLGVALWFHDPNVAALHASVVAAGAPVVQEPFDGPFGTTFTFLDPAGYAITVHDRQ